MGMVLRVPVIASESLESDLARLGACAGFTTVATTTDAAAEPLDTFCRPARLALVLGSEAAGLDPAWVGRCDRQLTIPMRLGAESLNVAVAAGIILYHVTR